MPYQTKLKKKKYQKTSTTTATNVDSPIAIPAFFFSFPFSSTL